MPQVIVQAHRVKLVRDPVILLGQDKQTWPASRQFLPGKASLTTIPLMGFLPRPCEIFLEKGSGHNGGL
jgi:hypothetical protein